MRAKNYRYQIGNASKQRKEHSALILETNDVTLRLIVASAIFDHLAKIWLGFMPRFIII